MSGSTGFTVTPAALTSAADALGGRADSAAQIAATAQDADVDTLSWGALGLGLGLYAGYSSLRNTADASIGQVGTFLQQAQTALQNTARDYEQADQQASRLFPETEEDLS